jgi:capsular polysaccharide biosynthesis protein
LRLNTQKIKFAFVSHSGEIWSPFTGWCNLIEGQNSGSGKLLRKLLFFHFKLFKKNRTIVLIDPWSSGYFHWIADVLPKLYLLRNELDSWEIMLPKKLNRFQKESLELFPIRNIRRLESWEIGICPNIRLMKLPWQSGIFEDQVYNELGKWIKEEILKFKGKPKENDFHDFIFVNRQNALSRRISNYADVLPILEKYHFFTPDITNLGFFDQVILFSTSKIIVGAHGAGLVNMMFMPMGSIVIEFRNSYPSGNNSYERLAKKLNHKYIPIVENDSYRGDFQVEDVLVPVNKLDEILAALT